VGVRVGSWGAEEKKKGRKEAIPKDGSTEGKKAGTQTNRKDRKEKIRVDVSRAAILRNEKEKISLRWGGGEKGGLVQQRGRRDCLLP